MNKTTFLCCPFFLTFTVCSIDVNEGGTYVKAQCVWIPSYPQNCPSVPHSTLSPFIGHWLRRPAQISLYRRGKAPALCRRLWSKWLLGKARNFLYSVTDGKHFPSVGQVHDKFDLAFVSVQLQSLCVENRRCLLRFAFSLVLTIWSGFSGRSYRILVPCIRLMFV